MNFTITYMAENGDFVTRQITAYDLDSALDAACYTALARSYTVETIADSTGKTVWYRDLGD